MAKLAFAMSDSVTDEQLASVFERVGRNSAEMDDLVQQVVDQYCAPIDDIITTIKNILDTHKQVADSQLEFYIMRIPADLYFANTGTEFLGIRDDISRLIYKEQYNKCRREASGTVADKDQEAELLTNAEALVSALNNRAYRIVKNKMDMAYEMLTALKKVLSHRMSEKDLSRSDTGNIRRGA